MSLNDRKSRLRKIAFLDRDGVINKKAGEHEYITKTEDFVFNEGIFKVLEHLRKENFEFIVVTNQRGVARGLLDEEKLAEVHSFMKEGLKNNGIDILDIFYCPHNENECDCRKPKDGLLRIASEKYSIDLNQSLFITDSQKEIEMGKVFGIKDNYFVESGQPERFFVCIEK